MTLALVVKHRLHCHELGGLPGPGHGGINLRITVIGKEVRLTEGWKKEGCWVAWSGTNVLGLARLKPNGALLLLGEHRRQDSEVVERHRNKLKEVRGKAGWKPTDTCRCITGGSDAHLRV